MGWVVEGRRMSGAVRAPPAEMLTLAYPNKMRLAGWIGWIGWLGWAAGANGPTIRV